ncbi:uncharacterized protein LOC113509899 [Galleria mellonella]|uniref:Uncharacterized protein LOC113509899 n=1 Tax=Galleria mellonella TaxID=7137 RepID=A0A6J1WF50_GALME|nr:uncharacterized protein LOC113509899 [Galleria mellonella]
MRLIFIVVYINTISAIKSEEIEPTESKKYLRYFRRQLEEVIEDNVTETATVDDRYLVSFLIKNVKKIFNDLYDTDSTKVTTISNIEAIKNNVLKLPTRSTLLYYVNTASTIFNYDNSSITSLTNTMPLKDNSTSTTFINENETLAQSSDDFFEVTEKNELIHLSKNLLFFETDQQDFNILQNVDAYSLNASGLDILDSRRSCIACNNVVSENCNDPKNKLISSTICARDDDLCYSLHTPFGIIDRGCFNTNHNLTTYVCSCNLCNYISISEMPYIFSKKRDWIENVVELSRTRHFRKSVFKDMSCLKCEVNMTTSTGDILDKANCLEGNVGTLPIHECKKDEICVVKAIKSDGYIWRGCIKGPLYNYWWTFCDSDLCNYDAIASIYDTD